MSLPKYNAYKESGIQRIGAIPDEWAVCLIKRYMTVRSGDMISSSAETEAGYPLIGGNGIRAYTTEFNTKGNTLVIGRVGALCGCVHHIHEDFWASEHAFRVIEKQRLSTRFFYYLLGSLNLNQFAIKTAQPLLNTEIVETQWIAVPSSIAEQEAIAAFLDRETAKIDELVAEQRRLIELLKEKRQAVISHAVTKGLNPDVPLKPSGIEWLGDVPAHWAVTPLGHLCDYISYGFTNPMPTAEDGPVMLTANDIDYGKVRYDTARSTTADAFRDALTDKSRPLAGDLLVTKDGTLGRVALHDGRCACINQSIALLRTKRAQICPAFLMASLLAGIYQERMIFDAGGTTIKHIYISRLAKMPVAYPDIHEQEQIVASLSEMLADVDSLLADTLSAIELLQERRTALISAAVTGKIDVRGLAATEAA